MLPIFILLVILHEKHTQTKIDKYNEIEYSTELSDKVTRIWSQRRAFLTINDTLFITFPLASNLNYYPIGLRRFIEVRDHISKNNNNDTVIVNRGGETCNSY